MSRRGIKNNFHICGSDEWLASGTEIPTLGLRRKTGLRFKMFMAPLYREIWKSIGSIYWELIRDGVELGHEKI